jgi:histidinol dehydrogenase
MKTYINPSYEQFKEISTRPSQDDPKAEAIVKAILERVEKDGDKALRELASEIDGISLGSLEVSPEEFAQAEGEVPEELKEALRNAYANIRKFHEAELPKEVTVETAPGVVCTQTSVPINKVGLYIPGGTAPLFSTLLMLAVPAKVAGCPDIILCTPPSKDGGVNPAILYTASLCGVDKVYKVGGAQAVAAMAYGTESISKRDKIFGPGNRFVMKAKQMLGLSKVSIDMPAGPSEVMVLADSTAVSSFVAADLLSQAEHGADSQVILCCDSEKFAAEVMDCISVIKMVLPRSQAIEGSLSKSRIVVFDGPDSRERMSELADCYAPEHLILSVENPREMLTKVTSAGSVFIGNYSPESAGDYASGTNHTLPTSGWARSFGGVCTESFMRKFTVQELTPGGLMGLSDTIVKMAEAEGLDAHAAAVKVRMGSIPSSLQQQ